MRSELTVWMSSYASPSSTSSSSRPRSSATVTPSPEATAQPSRPPRSTSTSSGSSSCPATRNRPSGSSSNSPAASAARTAPSSLPSFGPSLGRFGFTRSSTASTVAELDLLHAQLVRDLLDMAVEARALDDEPAQRLPQLDARGRARLPPELDDTPHRGDLVEKGPIRLRDLGPAGEVHRLRPVEDERPPEVVGDERQDRRRARAAAERARTRASANAAWSSPSQKRRRERRMYQFERSSTIRLELRASRRRCRTPRSRGRAACTKACVRSTSQRSSGVEVASGASSRPGGPETRRCSRSRRRT